MCLFKNFENLKQSKKPKKLKAMKTIKKLQIALVAILLCFATVANAQAPTRVTINPANPWPVDFELDAIVLPGQATQVDFVTVGAVMPYLTRSNSQEFKAWVDTVRTYFSLPLAPQPAEFIGKAPGPVLGDVRLETSWDASGTDLGMTTGPDSILVRWDLPTAQHGAGQAYILTATTDVYFGATKLLCGAPNASEKRVYVLPRPRIWKEIGDPGDQVILSCVTTQHTVSYRITGIGQKEVNYTVYKRPIGSSADTDDDFVPVGTAQSSDAFFDESNTTFNDAHTFYRNPNTATGGTAFDITVTGLQPGYVYQVVVTGISDQITRKSNVLINDQQPIWATDTGNLTYTFTVVPEPTNTGIRHILNVGW
jgi:hypothetical protein